MSVQNLVYLGLSTPRAALFSSCLFIVVQLHPSEGHKRESGNVSICTED